MHHHHEHSRYEHAKKPTLIAIGTSIFLSIVKLIGGLWFHSHGLFADGIHSIADIFIDTMVLFASKYGSKSADDRHPYGHQRIETAATLLLAFLLVLAGGGIIWDAILEIAHRSHDIPEVWTLPIAILSIVANEALFRYTHHVGTNIDSKLVLANAWHHRSDAASSIVVLIGIIGSLIGFSFLDALAAVVVGVSIIQMGWSYGWNSMKELIDTGVDAEMQEKLTEAICAINGVRQVHQLRTRLMGNGVLVDVHILVDPFISVSEGHYIAQHVHHALMHTFDTVKDVVVHVDPEDDEVNAPSLHLPNRQQLHENLIAHLEKQHEILSCVLHYIDGSLTIDLFLNNEESVDIETIIYDKMRDFPEISEIRLFYCKSTFINKAR